ncbi:hypothetical protein F5Y15DRAFT_260833 [Xylariaceae sp. FL0016]|nr:hypothetical protein F5Y15DRAFT_260833 [Xylariaceae sp. FL0016]
MLREPQHVCAPDRERLIVSSRCKRLLPNTNRPHLRSRQLGLLVSGRATFRSVLSRHDHIHERVANQVSKRARHLSAPILSSNRLKNMERLFSISTHWGAITPHYVYTHIIVNATLSTDRAMQDETEGDTSVIRSRDCCRHALSRHTPLSCSGSNGPIPSQDPDHLSARTFLSEDVTASVRRSVRLPAILGRRNCTTDLISISATTCTSPDVVFPQSTTSYPGTDTGVDPISQSLLSLTQTNNMAPGPALELSLEPQRQS